MDINNFYVPSFEEQVYDKADNFLNAARASQGALYQLMTDHIAIEARRILEGYELIKKRGDNYNSIVDITLEGVKVIDSGGIKKYLESKQKAIDDKKAREDAKFDIDFQNAKRVNKYFWLPLIISISTLIITVLKLFVFN